jgi:hypothetical protein
MKIEEQLAENYLKRLNLKDVIFRPDGNMPPDFSLGNKIAVEVLHLKQNTAADSENHKFVKKESGLLAVDEFIMKFNTGIEDITAKIKGFRKNYSSWWLVLVDQIAYKFSKNEKEKIKSMFKMNEFWNRVIVIDSLSGKSILEIAKIFEI